MMPAQGDEQGKPCAPGYLREIHHNLTAIPNHAAKAGGMGADERAEMLFRTKVE